MNKFLKLKKVVTFDENPGLNLFSVNIQFMERVINKPDFIRFVNKMFCKNNN